MGNRLYALNQERPEGRAISKKQRCHLIALLTEDQDDTPQRSISRQANKGFGGLRALVQISCRDEDAVGHGRRPRFTDLTLHGKKGGGAREVADDVSISSIVK